MTGYVRIHRSLIGHAVFRNDAEAMAFAWMIAKAAWKPAKVRYKERLIAVGRGQLAVSTRDMAKAMDRDKAWVERLWQRLKSDAMIETHAETGVTVVTICNYNEFQAERDTGKTAAKTPTKTGARQGQDTEQEGEELEEEKTPPTPRRGKYDFVLPEWMPVGDWTDFVEMRDKIHKSMTDRAKELAVKRIDKLRSEGWGPAVILQHCTLNGYQGIFAPKGPPQRDTAPAGGTALAALPIAQQIRVIEAKISVYASNGRDAETLDLRRDLAKLKGVPEPPDNIAYIGPREQALVQQMIGTRQ